jgi:hypothetical protein
VKQKFTIKLSDLPKEVPTDTTLGVAARIEETIPPGAKVTWDWLQSGPGSITTNAADVDQPNSQVKFTAGSGEGLAIFTASARVVEADGTATPVLPVTGSTTVKKGLRTIILRPSAGVFACTDPKACGVSAYTAFLVPKMSKAVGYSAVFSGASYPGCNRSESWTNENPVKGDGGGCNFPRTYHPHGQVTDVFALWVGFGGTPDAAYKCEVTITLKE